MTGTTTLDCTAPAQAGISALVSPFEGTSRFAASHIKVTAQRSPQLVDITDQACEVVESAGVSYGQCLIYCQHTTAALVINESEPLLCEDIESFLERIASSDADYRHDDFTVRTENLVEDHGRNAHAHLKCMVLGSSLTLPVHEGKLLLGTWQRIFMVEMDKAKERTLRVQVMGVAR